MMNIKKKKKQKRRKKQRLSPAWVSLAGLGSGLHPAAQEWCFPSFPSTSPPPSLLLPEPSDLPSASICFKLPTTMLGPGCTRKVSQIYCHFQPSLTLHRHCWDGSSSLKSLPRHRGTRAQAAGDEWSQLALWPCWGHGKGALGVPEVMLSSGQCPHGPAVTHGTCGR